jgi:sec-independent protein translocase protein TatA|tara:strand:- start:2751 stop:3017 length:267 start_codon:yes stop_codon:yes gene_type:complete
MNTIIAFLGPIGGPEMFLIFMVLLLLFGAKKLPQLARGIGKSVGEFRKAREEFEDEIRKGGEDLDNEVKNSDDDKVSKAPGAEPRTES